MTTLKALQSNNTLKMIWLDIRVIYLPAIIASKITCVQSNQLLVSSIARGNNLQYLLKFIGTIQNTLQRIIMTDYYFTS